MQYPPLYPTTLRSILLPFSKLDLVFHEACLVQNFRTKFFFFLFRDLTFASPYATNMVSATKETTVHLLEQD